FVIADQLTTVLLGDLLGEERRVALRALLGDRPIPEHEVAIRIIRAPEEDLAATRLALDDLAALVGVLRALHARRLVFDVLALRVLGAGRELAVASLLDDEVRAAARAALLENLIWLRGFEAALLRRDQLSRRLALGISGAGQELTEATALDGHRL